MKVSNVLLAAAILPNFLAAASAQGSAESSAASKSVTIYVSASSGNDHWSGHLPQPNSSGTDGPLATPDQARLTVESIDKTGLNKITVQLRAGVYPLSAPVFFNAADSGSPHMQIVYENYPGEQPAISGGVRVRNWVNIGGNTWTTQLPPSTVPFENLYYNGQRRLRPRVGGYLGQYFRTFHTVYAASQETNCPHEDKDPTDPHFGQYECFDRFKYDPAAADNNNPYADPWTNLVPAPGNLCGLPAGDQALWGDIEVLVFEQFSTSKLPVSCVDTTTHIVYLTGKTASPPAPHASETGFIEGDRYIVENVKNALTQPGQWFLDRTADPSTPMTLTYLAQPNEDPNQDEVIVPQVPQLLVASDLSYLTLRGLIFEHDNYTVPFPQGHVSTELEPDIGAAVSFQNSHDITFDSAIVREIAGSGLDFISCVTDPSGGTDPSTTPVSECVSTSPAPTVTKNVISNSAFYDIGALGVRIGEPYLSTDNDNDVPQSTLVVNNVVAGYGRTVPAAFGIGQGFGHDNVYTHNDVYDGYHCAISISTNAGDTSKPNGVGDAYNTISFNHVYNLLQGIMNDGGSIRIEGGNAAYTAPGNKIFNNRIHDVTDASIMDSNGYGGHGIYLDNETGLVDIENNLVYRVSDATVYTPHGPTPKAPDFPKQPNVVKNNILAYGRLGMIEEANPYTYPVPTAPNEVAQAFVVTNNLFYFDRNLASTSPFQGGVAPAPFNANAGCAYTPFAYSLYQAWNSNLYWRTDGAFASYPDAFNVQTTEDTTGSNAPCAGSRIGNQSYFTFYTFAQWQSSVGEDRKSVIRDPRFANPNYPADDYSLRTGEFHVVGFVPFDPNAAGRYPSSIQIEPPAIPATFATMSFNPATDF